MMRNLLFAAMSLAAFLSPCCLAQLTGDQQQSLAQHLTKAQNYLRDKQPKLAIPELEVAVAIDPSNVDARGNLGVLLFFEGKAAEAVPHLRFALERQPNQQQQAATRLQGLLGMAEAQTQEIANAQRDLEAAYARTEDLRIKVQVGLARIGLDSITGDRENAALLAGELRKLAPENPAVLYAAARIYSDLASESMLALSLVAPESAQMHQLIAHEDTRLGETAAAIQQYRTAIRIDPRLPGVHFELAEALSASPNAEDKLQAGHEYQTALEQNHADEKALCRLGEIAAKADKIDEAFADFTEATKLDPSDTDAQIGLAKILIDRGAIDQARSILEAVLRLEPANAFAHYRLGTIYHKLGREDQAKQEIDEYKRLNELKANLRKTYKELRLQPPTPETEENTKP